MAREEMKARKRMIFSRIAKAVVAFMGMAVAISLIAPIRSNAQGRESNFESRGIWLSQLSRSERKGFSILGIQPGDNIQNLQASPPLTLKHSETTAGLAELCHSQDKVVLEIWYRPETGEINAIVMDRDLSFERDGNSIAFSQDSLKSFEFAIQDWSSADHKNIGIDDMNEITAFPLEPGNQIGFISLSKREMKPVSEM